MVSSKVPSGTAIPTLKTCPWCGGGLAFTRAYPVMMLAPGDPRHPHEADVPEAFRTIQAWVCLTPLCRYRESA